jgi:hypothetical protein
MIKPVAMTDSQIIYHAFLRLLFLTLFVVLLIVASVLLLSRIFGNLQLLVQFRNVSSRLCWTLGQFPFCLLVPKLYERIVISIYKDKLISIFDANQHALRPTASTTTAIT